MSSISSLSGGIGYLATGLSSILDYSGSSSTSKSSSAEVATGTGSYFTDILASLGSSDTSGINNSVYLDVAKGKIGQMDKDGDGSLSESESKLSSKAFSALDTDGNGTLTAEELSKPLMAADMQNANSIIAARDTNGDGKLSSSELGWDDGVFSSLDVNGDGVVDASELVNAKTAQDSESNSFFTSRDTNGDGVLSSDEVGLSQDVFSMADSDGDGSLTSQETRVAYTAIKHYTDTALSQQSSVSVAA